jgi:hypothetical protein
MLVYCALSGVRSAHRPGGARPPGTLILDNPFGAASAETLIAMQHRLAAHTGLQLVCATGLHDAGIDAAFTGPGSVIVKLRNDGDLRRNLSFLRLGPASSTESTSPPPLLPTATQPRHRTGSMPPDTKSADDHEPGPARRDLGPRRCPAPQRDPYAFLLITCGRCGPPPRHDWLGTPTRRRRFLPPWMTLPATACSNCLLPHGIPLARRPAMGPAHTHTSQKAVWHKSRCPPRSLPPGLLKSGNPPGMLKCPHELSPAVPE